MALCERLCSWVCVWRAKTVDRARHRNGSKRDFAQPVSVAGVAASIGAGLAKAALAERVRDQTLGERLQSELFFEALRRQLSRERRPERAA